MRFRLLFAVATTAATLTGCGWIQSFKQEKTADKPKTEAPKLVGRVASVPADRRFVLIQGYGGWKVEAGTVLTTRGPENRTANLKTTGESMGEFTAADVQSGTLEVGDGVYSLHIPKPPENATMPVPTPELPENQQKPAAEAVQKNN